MTTAADVMAQLSTDNANGTVLTMAELRTLAGNVSAATTNVDGNGVLYAWELSDGTATSDIASSVAQSIGYGYIGDTDRAALLSSAEFDTALTNTLKSMGLTPGTTDFTTAYANTMGAPGLTGAYDGGISMWGACSTDYATSLTGNIVVIATGANENTILFQNELPAVLSNPSGGLVNDLTRLDLIDSVAKSGGSYSTAYTNIQGSMSDFLSDGGIAYNTFADATFTSEGAASWTYLGADPSTLPTATGYTYFTTFTAPDPLDVSGGHLTLTDESAPTLGEALQDGAQTFTLGSYTPGTLAAAGLTAAGLGVDAYITASQDAAYAQQGDYADIAHNDLDFAARLSCGYEGAMAGAAGLSELGPWGTAAGLVLGGVGGAVGGQDAVDAIWNTTSQLMSYFGLSSSTDATLSPDEQAAYEQIMANAGYPFGTDSQPLNSQLANLMSSGWDQAVKDNPNLTFTDYMNQLMSGVESNQQAEPASGDGPIISVEPINWQDGSDDGEVIDVFDENGNALSSGILGGDGSSISVDYDAAGDVTGGVSFDAGGSWETFTNQYSNGEISGQLWYDGQGDETESMQMNGDGTTTYDYFDSGSSSLYEQDIYDQDTGALNESTDYYTATDGALVADEQQFSADGSQQYEVMTTTASDGAVSAYISGQGAVVTLDDAAISIADGANATIDGSGNQFYFDGSGTVTMSAVSSLGQSWSETLKMGADGAETVTISGNGSVLNLSNTTIYITNGAQVTIDGTGDTIISGANDLVNIYGGNNAIDGGLGDSFTVGGTGNDVINLGSGNYLNVISGIGYNIGGTGDTITASANVNLQNVSGGNDTFTLGAGDYLGLCSGGGYSVTGTSDTIYTLSNTSFNLAGGNDTVNLGGTGDYLDLFGGTSYKVTGTGGTIATLANTGLSLTGSNDLVSLGGTGDYLDLLGGSGYTVYAASDTIATLANTSFILSGSYDTLSLGTGDILDIYGNSNNIFGNYDYIDAYGSYDDLTGGSDSYYGGGSDDLYDGYVYGGYSDYGYDDYGGYGGYGFAGSQSTIDKAVNRDIGQIALNDLRQGDIAGAAAADAALAQARQSADGASPGGSVFEDAKWDAPVITWSLAGPDGGSADAAEEAAAQEAFATWAAASGLTFEEVSDPAQADIAIEWDDLGTPDSGIVGYTTYQAQNGVMVAGSVDIRLEDPAEDALVTGPGGQLTYSGTEATLEQVMLHEIGHALGLGESTDPSSVMYYALTASNRTLDSTDIAGIEAYYSADALMTAPGAAQTARLIQAMAAYAPAAPVAGLAMDHASWLKPPSLAASAHH